MVRAQRLLAMLLLIAFCLSSCSAPVYAFVLDTPEQSENKESSGQTQLDDLQDWDSANALTPEGNLTLVDDVQTFSSSDKEFLTVQTKSGNYFYIIIERDSKGKQTVHFLNQVDEADLLSLIDEEVKTPEVCNCADKCVAGAVNTSCPVCKNNMTECVGKEKPVEPPTEPDDPTDEPDKEKSGGNPALIVLLLAVLGGGGALYYFKFKKEKPDTKGPVDLDDYDYGDEDDDDGFESEEVPEDDAESGDGGA